MLCSSVHGKTLRQNAFATPTQSQRGLRSLLRRAVGIHAPLQLDLAHLQVGFARPIVLIREVIPRLRLAVDLGSALMRPNHLAQNRDAHLNHKSSECKCYDRVWRSFVTEIHILAQCNHSARSLRKRALQ